MKRKLNVVYAVIAALAVIAGSAAAVSCYNAGWEWALDHAASANIGGTGGAAVTNRAGVLFLPIVGGAAEFAVSLDNEREIALGIKAGGITLDGTPPTTPPSVRFYTPGGAELSLGDNGYYYLPRPALGVRVKIINPAEGEYRLTLDLKAGDWSRPFDTRTAVVTCSANPVQAAVNVSAGTAGAPDVITVLTDIPMAFGGNVTVQSGKSIKLVSGGGRRVLKRVTGNTVDPLFTVNGELTLENIIVDGGAVWAGGTATPPSPAFGALNTGPGAVTAENTLIRASGAGAKLTLGAGAVLRNNDTTSTGGAVYMGGGEFTMSGGAVIRDNRADKGGGVYTAGGTFTMRASSAITGNTAAAGGGGAWVEGTITLNGGAINGNTSGTDGGGLGCQGPVTMNGGTINGNSGGNGSGVWIGFGNTFGMTAGEINNNTGAAGTSAIYIDSGTFDIQGGSVSGNQGPAFNINGWGSSSIRTLKMSGTAYIAPTNPVLFNGNCMTLRVTGTLTGITPVATITPSAYSTGTQILSGDYAANYTKFAITPDGGTPYRIDSAGKLAAAP